MPTEEASNLIDQSTTSNGGTSEPSTSRESDVPTTSSAVTRLLLIPNTSVIKQQNPKPPTRLLDIIDNMKPSPSRKAPYFTEIQEICREFGVDEDFDVKRPTTMNGLTLASKLELVQRLRGENKFLEDEIEKKLTECKMKARNIEEVRTSTAEVHNHCAFVRSSLEDLKFTIQELQKSYDEVTGRPYDDHDTVRHFDDDEEIK